MIIVFYANKVYGQYPEWSDMFREISSVETPEIYNGGFVYVSKPIWPNWVIPGWYTCDGCPYPEDQIDGQLKAWLLLLGIT